MCNSFQKFFFCVPIKAKQEFSEKKLEKKFAEHSRLGQLITKSNATYAACVFFKT
jgi:hypothetical protein